MRFEVKLDEAAFKAVVTRHASGVIKDAVFELRAKFAELFGRSKSGREYRRPSGTVYRASAPGEAPAIRSGNLLRSIRESFPDALTGQITIEAPYAEFLEEGTDLMAARPFVRPAVEAVREKFSSVRDRF